MAGTLPYVNQPGSVMKVFEKVKDAKTPDRFTQDFIETTLALRGGAYKQFIPFGKKLGLLNADATPTDLYKSYRNAQSSRAAIAQAMRHGYRAIFEKNENAHTLNREQIKGLIVEITGLDSNNRVVQLTSQTFESLRSLADFGAKLAKDPEKGKDEEEDKSKAKVKRGADETEREFDLALSYTINLVLPKTDDPAVFNAIFRSLRDNLLKK